MMKKTLLILLFVSCFSGIASAWTPLRFCVLPEIALPRTSSVYGLNIGLINGIVTNEQSIAGIDIAAVGSVGPVDGVQMSLVNICQGSAGVQFALGINVAKRFGGFQLAVFNSASENSGFFQLGLCNKSSNSSGFQLGLLNIMDNGFLPFFPIFNFSI